MKRERFAPVAYLILTATLLAVMVLCVCAGSVDVPPAVAEEVDADRTMVSETLAEIYAAQELYGRAVEIYKKLILLYPEKSAYFASLIEKVKDKKQP